MKYGHKILGIVLINRAIFEYDKRVLLLSIEHGKISVFAKYVNTRRGSVSGHLEPTNFVEMVVRSGQSGLSMMSVATLASYPYIRTNLGRLNLAYFAMQAVCAITEYNQPCPELAIILKDLFHLLNTEGSDLDRLRLQFQYDILTHEGLWPRDGSVVTNDDFAAKMLQYTGQSPSRWGIGGVGYST